MRIGSVFFIVFSVLISFNVAAESRLPFGQFLHSATCRESTAKSDGESRQIQEAGVTGDRLTYPLLCSISNGVVSCDTVVGGGSCLKSASFSYDFASKASSLTETYSGCINPPYLNGTYNYYCNVQEKILVSRATEALNSAACSGNESDVRFYLNVRDVEIDFVNPQGQSTLGCAFASGNAAMLQAILSNPYIRFDPYHIDGNGLMPVELSKNEDVLIALKKFLPNFDVNFSGGSGYSVLGSSAMSETLLAKIKELWPEAVIVTGPPGEACFEMDGSTITKFICHHKDFAIPSTIKGVTVTAIGDRAFAASQSISRRLGRVTIPDTVISIGKSAFEMSRLESIGLPKNLITIGDSAFFASSLFTVEIPDSVANIGASAFSSNYLESVKLPKGLNFTGWNAFAHNKLKTVNFPDGLKVIGDSAFQFNEIEEVTIPSSVETISESAFDSNSLRVVTLPTNLHTIGNSAFFCNKLDAISIPDAVIDIGKNAFSGNALKQLTIGRSVSKIGDGAFTSTTFNGSQWIQSCERSALTSIVIPDSVKTIGEMAFYKNDLDSLTIGKNVNRIGRMAFRENKLKLVDLPPLLKDVGSNAFDSSVRLIQH